MSVDFPAPLAPMRKMNSPRPISRFTSDNATEFGGYTFVTPARLTIGIPSPAPAFRRQPIATGTALALRPQNQPAHAVAGRAPHVATMSHSPSTAHPEHSSCVAHRVPDDSEGFDPICQFPAATSHHQAPPGKSRQCTMPDAVRAYQGASARRDSAARSDDASECAPAHQSQTPLAWAVHVLCRVVDGMPGAGQWDPGPFKFSGPRKDRRQGGRAYHSPRDPVENMRAAEAPTCPKDPVELHYCARRLGASVPPAPALHPGPTEQPPTPEGLRPPQPPPRRPAADRTEASPNLPKKHQSSDRS